MSITDDQADVIVGASELSDANRAQIEDIVTRKTGGGSTEYCDQSGECGFEVSCRKQGKTLKIQEKYV